MGGMNTGGVLEQNHYSKPLPAVAIVTITRNRCDLLLRLFSQIRELDYPKALLDIFLLDNASTDETVEKVQQGFPEVHLSLSDENLGITHGFNAGIKEALRAERNYKYIWLLDSDAEVDRETLMPLVETAEKDPNIAIIGSAVYEPNKRDQLVTAGFHIDWKKVNITYHIPRPEDMEGLFDVELIPACSSLTRADLFSTLGLWDERFWLYWGDTEWCLRALRNGYRVCCLGKSKVWHRNWANIRPDFSFPYALHDRVRSALLFSLLYNPQHSNRGIRHFILMNYLKAAFEILTVRPNFSRAYHEGVQDFLKGVFSKKDFSSWANDLNLREIDEICRILSQKTSKNPRIIINQIADESQKAEIRKAFQKYFSSIRWEEIPVRRRTGNGGPRVRLHENLTFQISQLLFRLLTFFNRGDFVISPVAIPCLYNISAAKHTLLLDASMRICVRKNRISNGFVNVFMTIIKGLRASYIDLPRALKNRHVLRPGATDW